MKSKTDTSTKPSQLEWDIADLSLRNYERRPVVQNTRMHKDDNNKDGFEDVGQRVEKSWRRGHRAERYEQILGEERQIFERARRRGGG